MIDRFNITILLLTLSMSFLSAQETNPHAFIPAELVLIDEIWGDLNHDGFDDCVLFVKHSNKDSIVVNRFDKIVDRNRRGLIVLFQTTNGFELITQNLSCFSSENDDGGVYYPPQLNIFIDSSCLIIDYNHGRYGYWTYQFEYHENAFDLIHFNSSTNYGPVVQSTTTINFVSKQKIVKVNENRFEDTNEEIYTTTTTTLVDTSHFQLSIITNFDELNLWEIE